MKNLSLALWSPAVAPVCNCNFSRENAHSRNAAFCLMTLLLVAVLWPGAASAQGTSGGWLTTIANPTPAASDLFGSSVASVAGDRVLVGAEGAAEAYLFDLNGTLLTTFTNPIPVAGDNFGTSVAVVGNDQVLISAIDYGSSRGTGGAAYLFNTNGTLLTTITNPTPAASDLFGCNDREGAEGCRTQTLNLKCNTSPSCTTYSLPSIR